MKVTWAVLTCSFIVLVVYGFLAVGDWAIGCAVGGFGYGLFAGAWWAARQIEQRKPTFSCPEEAFSYYDAVVNGRVLSADKLPESARKALEELKEDDA